MSPNTKLAAGSACSLMLALAGCASTPDPLMFDAGYDNQAGLTFCESAYETLVGWRYTVALMK